MNAAPSERRLATRATVAYPPLFIQETKTLDAGYIARQCWKGYLSTQPDP